MAEDKTPTNEPFRQNRDFRRFGRNFDFDCIGSILWLLTWLWVRSLCFLQRSLLGGQGGYNTSVFVKLITPTVLLVVNKEI